MTDENQAELSDDAVDVSAGAEAASAMGSEATPNEADQELVDAAEQAEKPQRNDD